ncbi:MAG: DCC1-like thiol-disulfide oxidoreductase family protein, partial [Candidatus Binatia bacterium]
MSTPDSVLSSTARGHEEMPTLMLARWMRADEVAASDRDWTVDLAVFRLALLAGIVVPFAWRALRWTEGIMPGLPPDAWAPVSFFALLPRSVLANAELAWWLAVADLVLLALALAGVLTRWTLAAATGLSLYVFGLMQNTGKVDHYHHLVWFLALAAVGPSAHFLSVDAIVAAIRGADHGRIDAPVPPRAALTTFRCIWMLFGLLYFAPGAAKLTAAFTQGWSSTENLRRIAWSQWFTRGLYQPGFTPPSWVDALPSRLFGVGAAAVIAFEVGFVWLVLFRAVRPVLAVAGVVFHVVNGLVLGIWFGFLLPAYAALIDWVGLGRRFAGSPLLVLYDGDCRVCRRAIAVLRTLDALDTLAPVPASADDPRRRRYAHVTDEMLAHDLWVAEGSRTARGFDAYRWIAWRMPVLWPVAVLLQVPMVARIGRRVYQ